MEIAKGGRTRAKYNVEGEKDRNDERNEDATLRLVPCSSSPSTLSRLRGSSVHRRRLRLSGSVDVDGSSAGGGSSSRKSSDLVSKGSDRLLKSLVLALEVFYLRLELTQPSLLSLTALESG